MKAASPAVGKGFYQLTPLGVAFAHLIGAQFGLSDRRGNGGGIAVQIYKSAFPTGPDFAQRFRAREGRDRNVDRKHGSRASRP